MPARLSFAFGAIFACSLAMAAHAESKLAGISFDIMPVGCRIHGKYSSGEQVVDEYIGRKGSKHIVKTYSGPKGSKLVRTTTYNADGFMIRKDWAAGGKWETFAPYSCFNKLGACSYKYRNADGQSAQFKGDVVRRGKTLVSSGGFVGDSPFPDSIITMGRFNAQQNYRDGTTTYSVTKYENCEK